MRNPVRQASDRRVLPSPPSDELLVAYEDAITALGRDGDMAQYPDDIPIDRVVGTVGRAGDFDVRFGLRNPALRGRWSGVAAAMEEGKPLPRVDLIRLGEMYFVVDGHHRVSVARERGHLVVPAMVRWVCTTAYAMACLRASHLPSKAAEREFLSRVPLPNKVRPGLWLDRPADWVRLADAAEAWGYRETLRGEVLLDRATLASRWWECEVAPLVTRLREAEIGIGLYDVQLYVTAMAARDRRGHGHWPAPRPDPICPT